MFFFIAKPQSTGATWSSKALEINPSDQDAKDNLKALGVTP
jgi:hypothetical protein